MLSLIMGFYDWGARKENGPLPSITHLRGEKKNKQTSFLQDCFLAPFCSLMSNRAETLVSLANIYIKNVVN